MNRQITFLMIIAAVSLLYILNTNAPRNDLIAEGDTLTFTIPYTYMQRYDGRASISNPSVALGIHNFIFAKPFYNDSLPGCEFKDSFFTGNDDIHFDAGTSRKTDSCWSVTNNYGGIIQLFDKNERKIDYNQYIDITYKPISFAHRYHEKIITHPDGTIEIKKYNFTDDVRIDYIITLKQVSKIITLDVDVPSEIGLGQDLQVDVNVRNELCGGTGLVVLDDNAVILNQWFVNKKIDITYDDCNNPQTFSFAADKLGRHDMTVMAYMYLPVIGALESKIPGKVTYQVVRDQVPLGYSGSNEAEIIYLDNREETTTQSEEVNFVLPPEQRTPISSAKSDVSPPINLRTLAIIAFIGAAAGILYFNKFRRKR